MGYSIGIRAKSKAAREKMLAFMQKNYRRWSFVCGTGAEAAAHENSGDPTDDLSYDRASLALGFDFGPSMTGWERAYVYSVCRWMALKIGVKRSRFKMDAGTWVLKKPVPYMTYDGYDHWPILVVKSIGDAMKKLPPEQRWCATDKYGVYIGGSFQESLVSAAMEEAVFYDQKVFKAFEKDLAKLGPWPTDDRGRRRHRKRHMALKAKHARPLIRKVLPIIREEMARLDQLWTASSYVTREQSPKTISRRSAHQCFEPKRLVFDS